VRLSNLFRRGLIVLMASLCLSLTGPIGTAQSAILGWGGNQYSQLDTPFLPPGLSYKQVTAGCCHTVALRSDGSVVAWGNNDAGQCDVPPLPAALSYVEVEAGAIHTVARRSDGSVVAWGYNGYGAIDVPALPVGLSYVEVSAGQYHTVARRSDGSVVSWGWDGEGTFIVPTLPAEMSYLEISAGYGHTVARRSDGSVVAWGYNQFGQVDVPTLPAGLSYVEVSAGSYFTVARRSDGSVIAWGSNDLGQTNVPELPLGLSYVEIAGGEYHTVARLSDGAVVAWGRNAEGQCTVPLIPIGTNVVEVAAGSDHTIARTEPSSPPTVVGFVRDMLTGCPVADATVIVPNSQPATTDANGGYTIYNLAAGRVTATASAPGFNPAIKGAVIVFGATTTLDFDLVPTLADLGLAVPGSLGPPALVGSSTMVPSTPVGFTLSNAKPFSLAPLVVGLSNLSAPFKGGTMVPYPNFIFPAFTDFFGNSSFGGLWPAGVPSGFTTYFQWWIQDPAGPQGYAASNAVAGTAP
jgi:hypothetical protein